MSGSNLRRLWRTMAFGLTAALLWTGAASAQKSAAQTCETIAGQIGNQGWAWPRAAGGEAYCRKTWMPDRPAELFACGSPEVSVELGRDLKKRVDGYFRSPRPLKGGGVGPDQMNAAVTGGQQRV